MPHTAPMQSIQVGNAKITYLPDGVGRFLATATFPNSNEAAWQQQYSDLVDDEQRMVTSIGGFLIETGERKIIIDLGTGPIEIEFPGFGPLSGGDYLDNFNRTGLSRAAVTDVIFSHMHIDHVGWTTIEGEDGRELLFPNADYYATEAEWKFWHGGDHPAGPHPELVQQPLQSRIQFVKPGDEFVPGLRIVDTAGHTPGHISFVFESSGERICLTADIWHVPAQVEQRDWTMAFDADPAQATEARKRLLRDELTREDMLVGSNHFSNRVFGRIVERDGNYRWQPQE